VASFSEKNAQSTGIALDKGYELLSFAMNKLGMRQ
jgi:hypothetical protein